MSYSKQQFRWARGALDVIFSYNPLFRRGLSWAQKIQYLSSASFYLSGLVVAIDVLLPLIFLYTGLIPIKVSGMLLAAIFLPYMFLTLYTILRTSNFTLTFASLGLSMSAFTIHIQALFAAAMHTKSAFSITPKEQQRGNFIRLSSAHIAYIGAAAVGIVVAITRDGYTASLVNNVAWVAFNAAIFIPFIKSSMPQRTRAPRPKPAYVR